MTMQLTKRYTPNELCQLMGLSKSTLFYWERENLIPKAKRSLNLRRSRYWSEDDARAIADYHYYRKTKLAV